MLFFAAFAAFAASVRGPPRTRRARGRGRCRFFPLDVEELPVREAHEFVHGDPHLDVDVSAAAVDDAAREGRDGGVDEDGDGWVPVPERGHRPRREPRALDGLLRGGEPHATVRASEPSRELLRVHAGLAIGDDDDEPVVAREEERFHDAIDGDAQRRRARGDVGGQRAVAPNQLRAAAAVVDPAPEVRGRQRS